MEAVIFSAAPTLLALLAGIGFLYRFGLQLLDAKKSETIPELAEDDSCGVLKESNFPAGWWGSKEVFELERRALFSKAWLCLSHRSRFTKAGDYQSYEVAGFPIFLILGKDGKVKAFHNVCRHRAYTVTKKQDGSSTVLGCRYHGWSYNTYGELTKAPHFDELPGFDRSQNGLFDIHTVTDAAGLVFVNLEASPTVSWVDTGLLDSFLRKSKLNPQSIWIAGQTVVANFNWKMALGSKNLIDSSELENTIRQKRSISWQTTGAFNLFQMKSEHFSVFPFTSFHSIGRTGWWWALSFLPASEQKTALRCDLYCSTDGSSRSQEVADKLFVLLKERVRKLETEYQESSVSVPSIFCSDNLEKEKEILDCLEDHIRLEKSQGTEVFPAMRKPRESPRFRQAEQLCKELHCKSQLKHLAW